MSEQTPKSPGTQPPQTGMQLLGEANRTPGFKATRDKFVADVNDWLEEVAATKEAGLPLAVQTDTPMGEMHLPFQSDLRRTRTELGRAAVGMVHQGEETTRGLWFDGDGKTKRRQLDAFFITPDGGWRYVRVVGADPVAQMVSGGEYSHTYGDTRAEVTVESVLGGLTETRTYEVKGNGALEVTVSGIDGRTTRNLAGTETDAQTARDLFAEQVMGWLKPVQEQAPPEAKAPWLLLSSCFFGC